MGKCCSSLAKRMDNDNWFYFKKGSFDNTFTGKARKIGGDATKYDVVKGKMVQ